MFVIVVSSVVVRTRTKVSTGPDLLLVSETRVL